jgi:hypothetical protein
MYRRSIVPYLNRKCWTARAIHADLVATLGEEAIAYSTGTKYLREAQTSPDDFTSLSDVTSLHIGDSDEAVLRALEKLSSSSVRQLSHATPLPKTTVYRRLSEKRWFTARHLRRVPHILSEDQKATGVQCSKSFLTILRAQ